MKSIILTLLMGTMAASAYATPADSTGTQEIAAPAPANTLHRGKKHHHGFLGLGRHRHKHGDHKKDHGHDHHSKKH